MTTIATQGWDVVGAIDQKNLNVGLGALHDRGTLPRHFEGEISFGIFSGSLSMDIERPSVNLGGAAQVIAELKFRIASGVL